MRLETLFALCLLASTLSACGDASEDPVGDNVNNISDIPQDLSVCDPANGPFSIVIDNPYLPFEVGDVQVLEGLEAGEDPGRVTKTVLDETEVILGVTTRVVAHEGREADTLEELDDEDSVVELSRHFYAQAPDGTVCHFGEQEDVLEDGEQVEFLEWRAGVDGARASIAMPANPAVGLVYTAAFLPATDEIEETEITVLGAPESTPAGDFDDTMTVVEEGPSISKFARGVGQIFDDGLELVSF